ncbi:hypothetical protein MKX03_008842 [Papaver bracteatum]|nr:hypothetical protein MKX03_008842 [Papaver bracteatum]
MRNSQGDHLCPQILLLIAIALVFISINGGSVSAADAYIYSSPTPPPYVSNSDHSHIQPPPSSSPPPPYMSTHLHHQHMLAYSSPPPLVKSPLPPYNNSPAITITGSGVVLASDEKTTYCVAKPFGVDENVLLSALNWVCGKVDCSRLLQGQPCFEPDTVSAHASYAFKEYYYQSGRLTVAMVTTTDPSHGNCTFSRHQSDPNESRRDLLL